MKIKSLLEKKKIVGIFSFLSLITGFLLLDKGMTGNVIIDNTPSFDIMSFIGLVLILCSFILAMSITKLNKK